MKDPVNRTKVVLRHLPPTLSPNVLIDHVDSRFAGRYRWTSFHPGKTSHKNMRYARAHIDFKRPEDVLEFAEFFDGHVFVNEKGTQFKTIVEYAPSQRIPKSSPKNDGREGTIFKDSEYLEFLEMLAKPVENLPSAEVQLERREAERAGGPKESLIVTPLMEFVQRKRAAKSRSQRSSSNGKVSRRSRGVSTTNPSVSHKRGPEKKRPSTSMYVLRDSSKVSSGKEKSSYVVIARKDEQTLDAVPVSAGSELLEDESVAGASGPAEAGKKKLLLLKGKEKEVSHASAGVSHLIITSPLKNSAGPRSKQNLHQQESGGRISILSNKEARQNSLQSAFIHADQQLQASRLEKEKRPPRPTRSVSKDHSSSLASAAIVDPDTKRSVDEKTISSDSHGLSPISDKPDRRIRNKERPDRVVWAPLRRSTLQTTDGSLATGSPSRLSTEVIDRIPVSKQVNSSKSGDNGFETASGLIASQSYFTSSSQNQDTVIQTVGLGHGISSSAELSLNQGETKVYATGAVRSTETKSHGAGHGGSVSAENGSYRYSRRGPIPGPKDIESLPSAIDGKPLKRGSTGYGSHEKQIWVQKSGSGS